VLVPEAGDVAALHVVADQRERDHQGDPAVAIVLDQAQQLLLRARVQVLAKEAQHVVHRVHVPARRGLSHQGLHEPVGVATAQLIPVHALGLAHQTAQAWVRLRLVAHELQLVGRVEGHQAAHAPAATEQAAQPAIREDPLDEVLARRRGVKTTLFLDG